MSPKHVFLTVCLCLLMLLDSSSSACLLLLSYTRRFVLPGLLPFLIMKRALSIIFLMGTLCSSFLATGEDRTYDTIPKSYGTASYRLYYAQPRKLKFLAFHWSGVASYAWGSRRPSNFSRTRSVDCIFYCLQVSTGTWLKLLSWVHKRLFMGREKNLEQSFSARVASVAIRDGASLLHACRNGDFFDNFTVFS
jgi:hypothetical protein